MGTADGHIELWDAEAKRCLRRMSGHTREVTCLSWFEYLISSGGKDTVINHDDVRVQNHLAATMQVSSNIFSLLLSASVESYSWNYSSQMAAKHCKISIWRK